jgi:hypothetical protein
MTTSPPDLSRLVFDATEADLCLAVGVLGPNAMYGGFINAALAGIYAERQRAAVEPK